MTPTTSRPPVAAAEAVATGGLVAFGVGLLSSPAASESGPVICPFRRLTGLECPACGLTRSWVDLAHGDLAGAVGHHPFGPVLLAGVVALLVLVVRARRDGSPPPSLERIARRPLVVGVAVVWAAYGVGRMVL